MASVTKIRNQFWRVWKQFGELVKGAFKETEPEAVDMNKDQMLSGIKADGSQIGEYTPFSKAVRSQKGLQTNYIDLKDTGDFQDAMKFTSITEEYAELESTDWKNDELQDRFGEEIFGLTETNQSEYNLQFLKELQDLIKKILWQG